MHHRAASTQLTRAQRLMNIWAGGDRSGQGPSNIARNRRLAHGNQWFTRAAVPGGAGTWLASLPLIVSPDAGMAGSPLELAALTKRYGTTVAVDAIDLRVPADTY